MTPKRYPAWLRRRRRGAPDPRIMEQLATAMSAADERVIREVLRADVVLIIDSGGFVPAVSTPQHGRAAVAAGLIALMAPEETSVAPTSINGASGFVLSRDEVVVAAVTAELRAGLLSSIWVVCNPEKLRQWNRD
ncbi:hypothetical protein ACI2IP_06085 [Microbacterium sp. NPDC090218]